MVLVWKNLNIEVRNNNANINTDHVELIQNSSGTVKPGELLAIMGPSGGGKTTLLKMLAGNIPSGSITQGEVLYKNELRNEDKWIKTIGFVEQDDIVYEDLTIEETIRYAGQFRDPNFNETKLKSIIQQLGLDGVSKNKMKKISGGQRKRTMIAIELIADPEILFLDEPTSGLDALTAYKLIEMLKKLAKEKNKIIIMSIHQPSEQVFLIFDQIMLLANTKQVYYGETSKIEDFFKSKGVVRQNNVALPDFIILVCDKDYQNANSSVIYTEQNIFEGEKIVQDKKLANKDNDFVLSYLPGIGDVCLLVKRKFSMLTHRKYKFFKGQLIKVILYTSILYLIYRGFDKKDESKDGIEFKDKTSKELMLIVAFGIVFIAAQVIGTVSTVYDDYKIIERELKCDTYSTGSYYSAIIIYEVLIEMIAPLILYGPTVYLTKIYSLTMTLVFLLTPFFSIPFAVFFGAIVNIRIIQTFLGLIVGSSGAIDPLLYQEIITYLKKNENPIIQKLSWLTYGLVIYIPVHFKATLAEFFYFCCRRDAINKGIAVQGSREEEKIHKEFTNLFQQYINGHHTGFLIILAMLIGSYLLLYLGGITLFGLNTMPERRLKLQKRH